MYDNNGYVNFNNLRVPLYSDDHPVTFKVRLPGYESVSVPLPDDGQDSFINLQIKLNLLNQSRQSPASDDSGLNLAKLATASKPALKAAAKSETASRPKTGDKAWIKPVPKPADAKPAARLKKASGAPKGTLTVYANLEGEFKADFDKPIWIYAKVYDHKGRRQAVLGQQADSHGQGGFEIRRFRLGPRPRPRLSRSGPTAMKWPFPGAAAKGTMTATPRAIITRPAFKTLTGLNKPGKAPKSVRLRMKPMPNPAQTFDEPGNGILQGQYPGAGTGAGQPGA